MRFTKGDYFSTRISAKQVKSVRRVADKPMTEILKTNGETVHVFEDLDYVLRWVNKFRASIGGNRLDSIEAERKNE